MEWYLQTRTNTPINYKTILVLQAPKASTGSAGRFPSSRRQSLEFFHLTSALSCTVILYNSKDSAYVGPTRSDNDDNSDDDDDDDDYDYDYGFSRASFPIFHNEIR
ncbi:hypothetical protein DBV15_10835 [Temnothorax longispinosus]|uniref:Uncharacterized protein n=1 Tax=Temnothorax longispinosus TaxID=300112 RepID=A0A4S2JTU3_9HYME|nr:hypothetical protein DBV15_10835 [Temnothorax longispinosus]